MNKNTLLIAFVVGQLVGLLGWIDALFLPLVLVGPPLAGAVAYGRVPYPVVAVLWVSAGLNMLVTDWVVTNADQVFHLALTVLMPLLAGLGYAVVRRATHQRVRVGD